MKAALLNRFGSPLEVGTLPDPVPGAGEIVVDVVAAGVLSYTGEVFSGMRNYEMELPLVPGIAAIGRVRATGPDSTRLKPGDWVACDVTVRSRDDAQTPDIVLQGWSARGAGGRQLMRHFRHGAFAAQMMIPAENAISLGPIDEADAGRWNALNLLLVPYGGFVAVDLQPGETVLVSGATGNLRQRRGRGRAGHGGGPGGRTGPEREGAGRPDPPVRGSGPDRAADRRPRAGPAAHAVGARTVRSTWCWTCCRPRRARLQSGPRR